MISVFLLVVFAAVRANALYPLPVPVAPSAVYGVPEILNPNIETIKTEYAYTIPEVPVVPAAPVIEEVNIPAVGLPAPVYTVPQAPSPVYGVPELVHPNIETIKTEYAYTIPEVPVVPAAPVIEEVNIPAVGLPAPVYTVPQAPSPVYGVPELVHPNIETIKTEYAYTIPEVPAKPFETYGVPIIPHATPVIEKVEIPAATYGVPQQPAQPALEFSYEYGIPAAPVQQVFQPVVADISTASLPTYGVPAPVYGLPAVHHQETIKPVEFTYDYAIPSPAIYSPSAPSYVQNVELPSVTDQIYGTPVLVQHEEVNPTFPQPIEPIKIAYEYGIPAEISKVPIPEIPALVIPQTTYGVPN